MTKGVLASFVLFAALLSGPVAALAGPDPTQLQVDQQLKEARKKQEQMENAKAEEQRKLLQEHMAMMHESMQMMQSNRPRPGMTMQEHEEWIAEHQRLMDVMMDQMMKDQKIMMKLTK